VKRARVILAVCFVIIVVVLLSRDGGLIRTMFSGADTEAIAGPQESTPEAEDAGEPEASASAAKDGDAKTGSEKADDDAPASDTGDPNAATSPAGGGFDYAQGGDEEFLDGIFTDEPVDTSSDPNQPGDSEGAFYFGGSIDEGLFDEVFEEEPLESINLNNVEMKNIIQTLGEWTGKPIIPTDDEVMKTRITIYATKKVPRTQALALVLAALKAKGVIAEQSADKIFLKPIATAKYGTVPTLPADEPLARMTDKSQIVEKFFQLENYSPTKLMSIITPLTAEYGHVTAMEDTGMIAIIDSVDNLVRIERIIRQLDVPESEQMVEKRFEIEFGDPLEIVQVLEFILNTEDRYRGRPPGGAKPSASAAGSVIVQQSEIPVRLIPIPKQNWIIARASSDVMGQITKWIEELDRVETVQSEQTIIQVRYADVREIENALDDMVREMPEQVRANIIIEPLTQARQLIVFGSAENRKMIERLVAEMDMPRRDIYVEKTFKLKHADPDQIKENIDGLYGDSAMNNRGYGGYGYNPYSRYGRGGSSNQDENVVKAISYPTQGQVTVIASEKNMKKIEKQITEEWDIPLDIEKDQYRILTLRNSDPVQLSTLLTKLFSEDNSSTSNLMRMIFGGRGSDTQKKIVGSLYGMLTFEPVPDTKKIIVISKIPEAYEVIEKLIMELDGQEKAEVPTVITLNYADPEDLCDQLNAILNEPGTQATLQRSSRGLSEMQADGSGGATSSGAGGANTNTGEITPWWTRQRSLAGEEMPTSNLIGQVRFIPVARSKAILVLAPPEYLDDIRTMVAELDQPGMQVMVKVVIVQVDHSSMTSLGVQLATDTSLLGALTENGATIFSAMAYADTFGAWTLSNDMNINTLVDLLVKNVNAKILNQPTLWTKDNEEAVFIKGKRVAFITNAQSDSSNITALNQSYNYDDVGLTLRVRPNITPEKAVDMTVNLIISQVDAERINDEIAVSNLDTTTHLIINNGQTVMLGGILFQNDSTVKRKVPLLGDIPVIGNLFRHTEKQLANDELLVFVTPYVIDANSLDTIPVDTDTDTQLREPFRRMKEIRGQLDKAMDWLATEIDEDDYDDDDAQSDHQDSDDTNKDESQTDDAIIEIRTNEPEK